MELGGKDPAYVRHDADLGNAVENLVDGSFFNSGQSCCGIERIYVHESNFHSRVEGFVELTKKYILGNPLEKETTLGPMAHVRFADEVRAQTSEAIAAGAKAHIDAANFPEGDYSGSLEEVKGNIERYGQLEICEFHEGWFDDTMPLFSVPVTTVYIDVDLATSELLQFITKQQRLEHKHLLLECTNLPPYKAQMQKLSGLPVTDILTLIEAQSVGSINPEFR